MSLTTLRFIYLASSLGALDGLITALVACMLT